MDVKSGIDNFMDKCKNMAGDPLEGQEEEVTAEKNDTPQLAEDKLKRIEAILKE